MKHLVLILLVFTSTNLFAQRGGIVGQVLDSTNNSTLPNAYASLTGKSFKTNVVADNDGMFFFRGIESGTYTLEISFLAFRKYTAEVVVTQGRLDLGKIYLVPEDQNLKEVNVVGHLTPVIQKGDTTEMSADAYKVNQDADGLDLVKKMPGISIENGKVKAHGEELKKVLVDGKDFFGDDPALSLQNLSADMVDKIQVFNKLSDQSEFIGFDDGQGEKVMNIITRPNRRVGQNGKFTAAYGMLLPDPVEEFDEAYQVSGRWTFNNKKGSLTLIGGSNNVNQQNFSMSDLSGVRGGGRGGFFGRMSGINTLHSMGANYSGNINPKLKISGSYFINVSENNTISHSDEELIGDINPTIARYSLNNYNSGANNTNHRFNINVEYQIDSLNSIIYRQNVSFQKNDQNSLDQTVKYNLIESPLLEYLSENLSRFDRYNYWGNLTFRHKFLKPGRTVSLGLQFSGYNQDGTSDNISNSQTPDGTIDLNQGTNSQTTGKSYSANLVYTEPLSRYFLFMVSYNAGLNPSQNEKFVYNNYILPPERIDSISNARESNYITQRGGFSLLLQKGKDLNASAGIEMQYAELLGEQSYPEETKTDRTFKNILPNVRLNYKISKTSNIRAVYRTSTSAPSITQLQPVIDITNPGYFSLGNPDLQPEYTHGIFTNFRYSNSEKVTNFGLNLFGNYTLDPIGKNVLIMEQDSVIYGQTLSQNGQLVKLVNLHDSWNVRGFANYSFLFKPIKCNLNFMTGAGYTTMPGIFNDIASTTQSTDFNGGLVIASNISQYIDFTISHNSSYTISKNNTDTRLNSKTWRHSISFNNTISTKNGFVFNQSLSEQIIRGMGENYNQDYLIWNVSVGRKIFKKKTGQVSIHVNDILDQNRDLSRTVSNISVVDKQTNTIGRYGLISFTYTLRGASKKSENPDQPFGPPGGRHMGPPPGGFPTP